MGVHITLIFVPDNETSPIPRDGISGSEWEPHWLIAPQYDGLGPFWFAHDDRFGHLQPMALALPLPNGQWYYHENPDWQDTKVWAKRVAQTQDAYRLGHYEHRLYTKS